MPDLAEDVSRVGCMLPHYRPWMTNWTRKEKRGIVCAQIVPTRNQSGSQPFVTHQNR
jgi:hypothetical protein